MRLMAKAGIFCATCLLLPTLVLGSDPSRVRLEVSPVTEGVLRGGSVQVEVFARIDRGWHINGSQPLQSYLIPTELRLTLPEGVDAEAVDYPEAQRKAMAFAGGEELLVYEGTIGLRTRLRVSPTFAGQRIRIEAALRHQACNDTTCLPPNTTPETVPSGVKREGETQLERQFRESGLVLTLLAIALLGLGLNLTPCVYPLISVTIAYFGSQSGESAKTARLALIYVLGIAASFSALGVTAALSGGLFGAALQKPVVVIFIAGILVVLALGSFGYYQFRPPVFLMRWAGGAAQGGVGALVMGLTMGVVAAPCVGPIVIGLLVFVGSRQDPLLGFLLFFVLALGMGAPYVVLAVAAGTIRNLPRSGDWLIWTERLFGCILLCLATYFVAPLFPEPARAYLLPSAVALAAFYLGFLEPAGRGVPYFTVVRLSVIVVLMGFAVWFVWPVKSGPAVLWEPGAVLRAEGDGNHGDRPLLIDFGAQWCIPCREMEHTTYIDPKVVREAVRFRMVKADLTLESDGNSGVVEKYGVRGVPTVILFSSQGEERQRMVGYVGPSELLAAMQAVN